MEDKEFLKILEAIRVVAQSDEQGRNALIKVLNDIIGEITKERK